jgi:hypothetical protein
MLNNYGAALGAIEKGGGSNPNSVILMDTSLTSNPIQNNVEDDDLLKSVVVTGYGDANLRRSGTVAMGLDSLLLYEKQHMVHLLTDFDSSFLRKQLDSLLRDTNLAGRTGMPPSTDSSLDQGTALQVAGAVDSHAVSNAFRRTLFRNHWRVQQLFLHEDKVYLSFRRRGERNPQMSVQSSIKSETPDYEIGIPATRDSIVFPSTLELAGFDTLALHNLTQNRSKRRELLNLYGSFNLHFIDDLSTEAFNKNNNAISILGFDISRKWFPPAMFIVLLVIYIMLYKTISDASKRSWSIISGYESDDALDFLIDNRLIRFAIWVVTPLALLFLVFYSTLIQYSPIVYTLLIAGGVSSFVLGWMSYKGSLKL